MSMTSRSMALFSFVIFRCCPLSLSAMYLHLLSDDLSCSECVSNASREQRSIRLEICLLLKICFPRLFRPNSLISANLLNVTLHHRQSSTPYPPAQCIHPHPPKQHGVRVQCSQSKTTKPQILGAQDQSRSKRVRPTSLNWTDFGEVQLQVCLLPERDSLQWAMSLKMA
jgi:hypothetical protein